MTLIALIRVGFCAIVKVGVGIVLCLTMMVRYIDS